MGMSGYYRDLREKLGNQLLFMPSVVGIIRNEKNEILFGKKHGEENWGLIAGAIEIGESPAQAIIREVKEETGFMIRPERIIGVYGGEEYRYTHENGHQVEYISIVFDCKVIGGELSQDNEEMKELQYFSEEQIPPIVNRYPKTIFKTKQDERTHFDI